MPRRLVALPLLFCLLGMISAGVSATVSPERLDTDLPRRIAAEGNDPRRFAVAIPLVRDSARHGEWHRRSEDAIWRYAVTVPGALGLGARLVAPNRPEGTLIQIASGADGTWRQLHVRGDKMLSPMLPGDTLHLRVVLPAGYQSQLDMQIEELQAAYRGVHGKPDHPTFRKAATKNGACPFNYRCAQNSANTPVARATARLVIENQLICSGTVIGNTRDDLSPLLLTAAHCQANDKDDMVVAQFGRRTDSCGDAVDGPVVQSINVVALEGLASDTDGWLLRLESIPDEADPYWLGWDATDVMPDGSVYMVHHAGGNAQQWAAGDVVGKINASLNQSGFTSIPAWLHQWSEGTTAGGSSGSALIRADNRRLIGVLSGGAASCENPDGNDVSQRFAKLYDEGGFDSFLDPDATGATTLDGRDTPSTSGSLSLSASSAELFRGETTQLQWSGSSLDTCTASGAWSGDRAVSGNATVGPFQTLGERVFSLDCSTDDGGQVSDSVAITVVPRPDPEVSLDANPASIRRDDSSTLMWNTSHADSCVASGDWSGARATQGQESVGPFPAPGERQYTLRCDNGEGVTRSASAQLSVLPLPPAVSLSIQPATIGTSQQSTLDWSSENAESCAASGDWDGPRSAQGQEAVGPFGSPGERSFRLECRNSIDETASRQVQLEVLEGPPPDVSLTLADDSVPRGGSTSLSWSSSNAQSCTASGDWSGSRAVSGSETVAGPVTSESGERAFILSCSNASGATATADASLLVLPPPAPTVGISVRDATVTAGEGFDVSWQASGEAPLTCRIDGDDGLALADAPASGSVQRQAPETAGSLAFSITCSNDGGSSEDTVTVRVREAQDDEEPPQSAPEGGGGAFGALWGLLALLGLRANAPAARRR